MLKKIVSFMVGVGFLAIPLFATAQGAAASAQIQALLVQIQALQAQIDALQSSSASSPASSSCADIQKDLTFGSSGTAVKELQNYLIGKGYLDAQYDTGYFGRLTAIAVGKAQLALHVVTAATDGGYGIAGPKTRAALSCPVYTTTTPPAPAAPSSQVHLTATPTSGTAPLLVSFSGASVQGGKQYIIDYGDGENSGSLAAVDVCMHLADGSGGCPRVRADHTYSSAGTYTATIEPYIACAWGPGVRCMIAVMPLATSTVTVAGPIYSVSSNMNQPSEIPMAASRPVNPVLQNPGALTAQQLTAYPNCDIATNAASTSTCTVGQAIGSYLIVRSINTDNTVSFYRYAVPPSTFIGETWSPTTVRFAPNQSLSDQCGRRLVISSTYPQENDFTILALPDSSVCPM